MSLTTLRSWTAFPSNCRWWRLYGRMSPWTIYSCCRPTLIGLISAREVDSVLREPEIMPDGLVVGGGLGLQSPLFVDKIQQSDYLKAVASQPPSKGKVRAVDHTSTMTWYMLSILKLFLSIMHQIIMKNNCVCGTGNGMKGTCVVVFLPRQLGVFFHLSRKAALGGLLEFYFTK